MTIDDFVRAALAYHVVLFPILYALAFHARKARTNEALGARRPNSPLRLLSLMLSLARYGVIAVCVGRVFTPDLDRWLVPIPLLAVPPVAALGVILLASSGAAALYVMSYMGADWRAAIDPGNPGELLTAGPYTISRNPMYAGLILGQAGLVLALPSLFTLAAAAVAIAVLYQRALSEALYLERLFGEPYRRYAAETPLLFGLPRRGGLQAGA